VSNSFQVILAKNIYKIGIVILNIMTEQVEQLPEFWWLLSLVIDSSAAIK